MTEWEATWRNVRRLYSQDLLIRVIIISNTTLYFLIVLHKICQKGCLSFCLHLPSVHKKSIEKSVARFVIFDRFLNEWQTFEHFKYLRFHDVVNRENTSDWNQTHCQKNFPPDFWDASYTFVRVLCISSIVGRLGIDSDHPRRSSRRIATGHDRGTEGRSPKIDTLSFT